MYSRGDLANAVCMLRLPYLKRSVCLHRVLRLLNCALLAELLLGTVAQLDSSADGQLAT